MTKNNNKGGESLPLARTRKQSLRLLSTPSPRGKAPKTPEGCHTDLFTPNGVHELKMEN